MVNGEGHAMYILPQWKGKGRIVSDSSVEALMAFFNFYPDVLASCRHSQNEMMKDLGIEARTLESQVTAIITAFHFLYRRQIEFKTKSNIPKSCD